MYIKWQETQQSTSKIISPERYANFAKCSALSTEIKMDVKISLRWTFFLRKKVLTKIVDSKLLKNEKVKNDYLKIALNFLNNYNIPNYLKCAKMI